jgi:hypothetical protein
VEPLAVIALAGGSYEKTSTSGDSTEVTLVRAGTGLRWFPTQRADVEPSIFLTASGQYAEIGDSYGGVVAEVGGSLDASVSENVAFRVGASVVRAGFFTGEAMSDTTLWGVGLGPHAELRVKW